MGSGATRLMSQLHVTSQEKEDFIHSYRRLVGEGHGEGSLRKYFLVRRSESKKAILNGAAAPLEEHHGPSAKANAHNVQSNKAGGGGGGAKAGNAQSHKAAAAAGPSQKAAAAVNAQSSKTNAAPSRKAGDGAAISDSSSKKGTPIVRKDPNEIARIRKAAGATATAAPPTSPTATGTVSGSDDAEAVAHERHEKYARKWKLATARVLFPLRVGKIVQRLGPFGPFSRRVDVPQDKIIYQDKFLFTRLQRDGDVYFFLRDEEEVRSMIPGFSPVLEILAIDPVMGLELDRLFVNWNVLSRKVAARTSRNAAGIDAEAMTAQKPVVIKALLAWLTLEVDPPGHWRLLLRGPMAPKPQKASMMRTTVALHDGGDETIDPVYIEPHLLQRVLSPARVVPPKVVSVSEVAKAFHEKAAEFSMAGLDDLNAEAAKILGINFDPPPLTIKPLWDNPSLNYRRTAYVLEKMLKQRLRGDEDDDDDSRSYRSQRKKFATALSGANL